MSLYTSVKVTATDDKAEVTNVHRLLLLRREKEEGGGSVSEGTNRHGNQDSTIKWTDGLTTLQRDGSSNDSVTYISSRGAVATGDHVVVIRM